MSNVVTSITWRILEIQDRDRLVYVGSIKSVSGHIPNKGDIIISDKNPIRSGVITEDANDRNSYLRNKTYKVKRVVIPFECVTDGGCVTTSEIDLHVKPHTITQTV